MIKMSINYTDYNGNVRNEEAYFHMTEAELAKLEMGVSGGYSAMVKRLIDAQDQPSLITVFEELIKLSYGIKTPDGRGFKKKPEYLEDFMSTEGYSNFYMELATNTEKASEFINGIIPEHMKQREMAVAPTAN